MKILYTLIFLYILIINSSFNQVVLPNIEQNQEPLEQIISHYFGNVKCLIQIRLKNQENGFFFGDNLSSIFTKNPKPTFQQEINVQNLRPNFKMILKPRRDIFFGKNQIVTKYCPETFQGSLIITNTFEDLKNYIFSETFNPFWSQQSKTLALTKNFENQDNLLEKIWKIFKVPNVVIFDNEKSKFWTYDPFDFNRQKWGLVKNFNLQEATKNKQTFFIEKNLKNLNGYQLNICLFRSVNAVLKPNGTFEGLEVTTLNFLSNYLNFTYKIVVPSDGIQYGYKVENYTFTGALQMLLQGQADYIGIHYFLTDYSSKDVEFLASVTSDALCLIIRKADKVPEWRLLYYCLEPLIWVALFCTFLVISISKFALGRLVFWLLQEKRGTEEFLETFRIMLSASLPILPTTNSERIFLSACLLAFVTITGAFQGSLVSVFSATVTYNEIDTLEDLSWSNKKIISAYPFLLEEIFHDEGSPQMARLKNMLQFWNGTEITRKIAESHTYSTFVRNQEFDLDQKTSSFLTETGSELIHKIKECPRTYNLAMVAPVNFYLAPTLNEALLKMSQAGLFLKWYNEDAYNVKKHRTQPTDVMEGFKIFSIKDLQISFLILIFGNLSSFLVFLVEIKFWKIINSSYSGNQISTNKDL